MNTADCGRLLSACGRIITYLYDNKIKTTQVRAIPPEYREDIDPTSVAALLSSFGRSRPKNQPARMAGIFGRFVSVDHHLKKMILVKENLVLPVPADYLTSDVVKLSYVKVYDDEVQVIARVRIPVASINDIPMAGSSWKEE